jgi:hypothetical protein
MPRIPCVANRIEGLSKIIWYSEKTMASWLDAAYLRTFMSM